MFGCRRLSTATFVTSLAIDHNADANMAIESLETSKAAQTKPQKLIKEFPDGMNSLYE